MAVIFREARHADLPALIDLLADDALGRGREGGAMGPYEAAFEAILAQPGQTIVVGEVEGWIVAMCQLTILPGLAQKGQSRALIESVRTAAEMRGQGIGAALMAECEARARAAGATKLQLIAHQSRGRAHAFYERLGYQPSHLGFVKAL
jgi:ribosomal protein S18 acetylase RimI-like enzyme